MAAQWCIRIATVDVFVVVAVVAVVVITGMREVRGSCNVAIEEWTN